MRYKSRKKFTQSPSWLANLLLCRQKDLYNVYREIVEKKEEAKLLELVNSGELRPDEKNAEGQTPLMIAVEAQFSVTTIKKLVELGCDVNA